MSIEPFAIFTVTLENGAHIGISRLPGRGGDLTGDVAQIAQWGAACVVSMTDDEEMTRKGGAGLSAALAVHGIVWRVFAVRDYGAPHEADMRWPPISGEVHQLLDQGKAVLLHCAGGQGRSGMVAMRLMCERGMSPQQALEAIRAVRPGAVETIEQENWAGQKN